MGSLFRSREWWATRCGIDEVRLAPSHFLQRPARAAPSNDDTPNRAQQEFDRGCMCVGNVSNDRSGDVQIVVGSYSGMLRVFQPRQRDYNVQDLLLEQSLGAPILHVAIGRFAHGTIGEGATHEIAKVWLVIDDQHSRSLGQNLFVHLMRCLVTFTAGRHDQIQRQLRALFMQL